MRSIRSTISANLCALGLLSIGVSGCSGDGNDGTGDGSLPGGATSSGGSSASAGAPASGGSLQTPGGATSGGSPASGGKAGGSGGSAGSAGSAGQGMPGAGTGGIAAGSGGTGAGGTNASAGSAGSPASGGASSGMGGSGPMGGRAGMGGSSAGGGGSGGSSSGECMKGQTKGNQVAVIGESFIAATHGLTREIEANAKAAGSLGQNERYVDNSVSGTTLAGNDQNAIPNQYKRAAQSNMIEYVLMDGGGNDCLLKNNGDAALAAAEALFQTMAQDGVKKVVYFFYPDPLGTFGMGSLKTCLDTLRPKMKALCDGLTAPKCYWLDLRTVWNGHPEYTQDGIHPTAAGDKATGAAIWEVMKENCVAQ